MNYNNQKIVKRIAEIEGLEVEECEGELLYWPTNYAETYDPINNAGQAMELLKGLRKGHFTLFAGNTLYGERAYAVYGMTNGETYSSTTNDEGTETPELAICLAYLASKGEDLTQFEEAKSND